MQVLVTNDGVSSGLLTLSCRADVPAPQPLPEVDLNPIPDPATGVEGPVEELPEPPGPRPAGADDVPDEEVVVPGAMDAAPPQDVTDQTPEAETTQ